MNVTGFADLAAHEVKRAVISSSANPVVAVAAVVGKKIRVISYALSNGHAATTAPVKFQSASTDLTGAMQILAGNTLFGQDNPNGHVETVAGEALNIVNSATLALGGYVNYVELG